MADIFVSYARPDEPQAERVAEALRSQGYRVWRDDELPAHRSYADVIEERIKSANAVVVLWSAKAARSQWVRAEADAARAAGTLVQATIDGGIPPMPFNQIQCADLKGWRGNADAAGWRKLVASVADLAGAAQAVKADSNSRAHDLSVCVLPFQNMSGEAEQEYFSDGISEDITTDLSKVSALGVTARNTAFTFKGQAVNVRDVARAVGVSHVLEGSVRKAGGRVRITAQLIDGASGEHVWAERYDRDLTDIFAIQDEISNAIVGALKLKLLPEEKKAIQTRGTASVEAYNLYLMARQYWISGVYGDVRKDQAIIRICKQAVSVDPDYAEAWALMALAQAELRFWHGMSEDALPAAERALALNPDLPEARCVKARYLESEDRVDDANREIAMAMSLDPESWEVNREAARLTFRQGRMHDAIRYFEKATELMNGDFHSPGMLMTCYLGTGEEDLRTRAARVTIERSEAALAKDPANGVALAFGASALLSFGEDERAKEWIQRALMLDPDNHSTLYNLACAYAVEAKDVDSALAMLEKWFDCVNSATVLKHSEADPDLDCVRSDPRFEKMLADARTRLKGRSAVEPTRLS